MSDNSVEQKYQAGLDRMSGLERLQRTFGMYDFVHQMLEIQISKENPDFSPRRVKIEIAKRMYLSDPAVQAILKRLQDEHERTSRDPAKTNSTAE